MFLLNPVLKDWIAVVCILGTVACTPRRFGTALESFQPIRSLNSNHQQTVLKAENEYRITRQQGDLARICAQAELVATAYLYLQGHNSKAYQFWKLIEQQDCDALQAEESRMINTQINRSVRDLQSVMDQPIN